ncbi:flagellar motor protein [Dokdonella sp. MW10]|uniref:flagellar motor protein n=1 Tax=Dokdonella sp. MW10 TaxID=2992926 RepID=UPI003F80608C
MQKLTAIGIVMAFVVVITGALLKGAGIHALWSGAALVVVFVGTASAIMVQTPGPILSRALKMLKWLVNPPHQDMEEQLKKIVNWSETARRQGLLGLEPQVEAEPDAMVKKGLQLLVDGTEPDNIRNILGVENDAKKHNDMLSAKVFEAAGIYAPTMGIIGAVLGLMAVMQNLADPSKLGPGIAGAFVSTVYGIGLANLLLLPMANKLKLVVTDHSREREMMVEGIAAIAEGENPRNIESKLRGYVH